MKIPEANRHQQLKSPNALDLCHPRRADARKSHADVIIEENIEAEEVVEKATGKEAVNETLYEVKFLASENCTESDITECFTINFEEALKRIGINDERSKFEIFKVQDNHLIEEDGSRFRFLHLFKVKVNGMIWL